MRKAQYRGQSYLTSVAIRSSRAASEKSPRGGEKCDNNKNGKWEHGGNNQGKKLNKEKPYSDRIT